MTCSGTAAVCCGADARHRPPVCKTVKLGGRGSRAFLERWCLAALHYTISSYEKLYSLKFFIFKSIKQAVLVAKLVA